jgi:hypothetical protein
MNDHIEQRVKLVVLTGLLAVAGAVWASTQEQGSRGIQIDSEKCPGNRRRGFENITAFHGVEDIEHDATMLHRNRVGRRGVGVGCLSVLACVLGTP